jgi:uncharacterized membrane protein YccC
MAKYWGTLLPWYADPGRIAARHAARTVLAALVAGLLVAAVGARLHQPGGAVVTAVVTVVMSASSLRRYAWGERLAAAAALPVLVAGAAAVAWLMAVQPALGSAAFVVAVFLAAYARRFTTRVARLGRLALIPFLALLVAPVPPQRHPAALLWLMAAGAAGVLATLVALRAVPDRPDRAVRAAVLALRRQALRVRNPDDRHARRVRRAARVLAAQLPAGPEADDARIAGFRVEYGITAGSSTVECRDALAELDRAVAAVGPAGPQPGPEQPPTRAAGRLAPQTRLALQLATGLAAAFVLSHLLFPQRWSWSVISAFVITGGARSRGDVAVKAVLRLCGAAAGTVAGTAVAYAARGHPHLAVAVLALVLAAGIYLRELTYAAWAYCVTVVLGLLYGLYGDAGLGVLGERLLGVCVGVACGLSAAFLVVPIRTGALVRRRLAQTLASLDAVIAAAAGGTTAAAVRALAAYDRDADELRVAARPYRVGRALVGRQRLSTVEYAATVLDAAGPTLRRLVAAAGAPQAADASRTVQLNVARVRGRIGGRPTAAPIALPHPREGAYSSLDQVNETVLALWAALTPGGG